MCDNAGVPQQFQAGGPVNTQTLQEQEAGKDPVYDTIAGREFLVGTPGEYRPGIGDIAMGMARAEFDLPEQEVAGFTPEQMQAFGIAQEGVGSFHPFLKQAESLTKGGVGALEGAARGTQRLARDIPGVVAQGQKQAFQSAKDAQRAVAPGQRQASQSAQDARLASLMGMGGLSQTGGMFDPSSTRPFMNQFEDAAVQQALQDIARQGEIAGQGLRAQAVGSGAFGGSRQAVAEQELQRNVLGEQGRTAAGMRQAGFESAAQRSQAAFEEAMRRQQLAAQGIGQLGIQGAQTAGQLGLQGSQLGIQGAQAAGNLGLQGSQLGLSGIQAGLGAQQQAAGIGQGIAGLGQQMVGIGQAGQQLAANDVNSMLGIGGMQQQLDQAQMDAQRANQFQQTMQPFQQLAYASDIIQGLPSGQTTTQLQPGPSVGSQVLGLGVGGAAMYNAFKPSTPTPAR